jgi:SPP1 family predicted phage head-tail adaptor
MRAGKLDRRITIQRLTDTGRDAVNAPIVTWEPIATVWGQKRPMRGDERFSAHQVAGSAVTTFVIRYRPDVTVNDRIMCEGLTYDIRDIRELGRREALEIDAVARTEP